MEKQLAIKGHEARGKEVIEILEMFGASNKHDYRGCYPTTIYILNDNNIDLAYTCDCDNQEIFTLEEFLEKYPYKIGDKAYLDNKLCSIIWMCWECNNIYYQVQGIDTMFTKKVAADELKPYKEEVNMKDNKLCGTLSNPVETKSYAVSLKDGKVIDNSIDASQFMQIKKTVAVYFNTENYENEVELILDNYEIVTRGDKTFAIKKKPKYPTTYEECCGVLGMTFDYPDIRMVSNDEYNLYSSFIQLIRCRDAYWKIAGEEMELNKPWKQDYDDRCFIIANNNGNIHTYEYHGNNNVILAFPTKEMRDVFYENFKDLIEKCKELL